jgi:branched-subunit amino acid transport protein
MRIILLIAALMAVTWLPRMIPFFWQGAGRIPRRVGAFLKAVPFAALGALLFPDSLTALGSLPLEMLGAAVALTAAAATAWFSRNILLTFAAGTGTALLWLFLF